MTSSCSIMTSLAIPRRYYYLRERLGPTAAPLQLLQMMMANTLERVDKYTSSMLK